MSAIRKSDHALSSHQADLLKGIVLLPRDIRIEAFTKLFARYSKAQLFELLADIVGLSNGVVEATREFVELYLIIECDHHNQTAEKINLPTLFGALNGIDIAIDPVPGMCSGCAFRIGTPANQSECTTADARDAVTGNISCDFLCHMKPPESPDGERPPCAGYLASLISKQWPEPAESMVTK